MQEWQNLQFQVDSERHICESFCQKSAERKSSKQYIHIFVLTSDLWFDLTDLTSNKPTQYLLDYGEFNTQHKGGGNCVVI